MASILRPGPGEMRGGALGSARGRPSPLGSAASAMVGTPRSASSSSTSKGFSSTTGFKGPQLSGALGTAATGKISGSFQERQVEGPKAAASASMGLVRAIKATHKEEDIFSGATAAAHAGRKPSVDSDEAESDNQSVCSNMSSLSNMSNTHPGHRSGKSGSGSSANGNKSMHISFSSTSSEAGQKDKASECTISIEQQGSAEIAKMSLCADFSQLCPEGQTDGLAQCLQMNRFEEPTKLQQHVIPILLHLMGKELGGHTGNSSKGKSCMVVQAPAMTGKTSAVVLAMLASIDLLISQPQVILLSSSPKRELEQLLSVFTLMQSIKYQVFAEEDLDPEQEINERSPEVKAARAAHILVGHPRHILAIISSVPTLCLDSVKGLVIDDIEELLVPPQDGDGRSASKVLEAAAKAGIDGLSTGDTQAVGSGYSKKIGSSSSSSRSPLLDDLVQIGNVIEARQYSQDRFDTYSIRKGTTPSTKLRYVMLSQTLPDAASRKVLRLLKNSLMKKKSAVEIGNLPAPTRIIKAMKHYYAVSPRADWVRVFAGLVDSLMFPRAVIFCDNGQIEQNAKEMQDMGLAVSVNVPDSSADPGEVAWKAVQDFTSNQTQFLLTRAEPSICQIVLPKVSSVFHFGLPPQQPSLYGVRLLPMDADNVKDVPSILFVDASRESSKRTPPQVRSVGKLFDLEFLEMPFEFLPSQPTAGGRRSRR